MRVRRCHAWCLGGLATFCAAVTLWFARDAEILYRLAPSLFPDSGPGIECYFRSTPASDSQMPEVSQVDPQPPRSTSIFFHETSCSSSAAGTLVLSARQACAVESAALMNPQSQVYLLFTAPVSYGNSSQRSEIVKQLDSYSNVHLLRLDFERYFIGTPLQEWYHSGTFQLSRWPRSHASDVLRFLTLWKYGGTYLDLDVVVTKSLQGMRNFAGAESNTDVAAGVLNLSAEGPGRALAEACIEDLRSAFRGDDWGNNGPGVITRVLKRACKADKVRNMTVERCHGFTVYPPSKFYPIPWRKWRLYFSEAASNSTMALLADAIAIHVWNKFSIEQDVIVGSRQPYALVAQKYCPKVYANCGAKF